MARLTDRPRRCTIVDHRQMQFARLGGDADGTPGWCRVFNDVGQRLLHDSIRRELNRRRQRWDGPALKLDLDVSEPGVLDESWYVIEAWAWRQLNLPVRPQ